MLAGEYSQGHHHQAHAVEQWETVLGRVRYCCGVQQELSSANNMQVHGLTALAGRANARMKELRGEVGWGGAVCTCSVRRTESRMALGACTLVLLQVPASSRWSYRPPQADRYCIADVCKIFAWVHGIIITLTLPRWCSHSPASTTVHGNHSARCATADSGQTVQ
jgi:hypothetical protein